jgi:ribosome biogenesis GTPase
LTLSADGFIRKALAGFYFVRTDAGEEYMCRGRGILRREGMTPLVGDRVSISVQDEEEGVIDAVHPRGNAFVRPPVANVDIFVCVIAAADPQPNPAILDRFLVTAEAADVPSLICINKTDLNVAAPAELNAIYGGLYPIVRTSAVTGGGADELKEMISGRTAAFAGPSGVGKSSLISLLTGNDAEVGGVSKKTGRGKHTTRHVEIYDTDFGARIFDTPGYMSFTVTAAENARDLAVNFPEIGAAAEDCRFGDCAHIEEPDCRVRAAVAEGSISQSRYNSYVSMLAELTEREEQ